MICLSSQLPTLQVGPYQLKNYETQWLYDAIHSAFCSAQIADVSMASEIYAGVLHYLKNECPWTLLDIEKLYQRLSSLLETIGFPRLSGHLPRLSPPVEVPLTALLEKIDAPIELTLHQALRLELQTLRKHGASCVTVSDIEEAVRTLLPAKKWSKKCERLKEDLLELEVQYNRSTPLSHGQ